MKTSILHEWLTVFAGAELVLQAIHECYPSPIYTLIHDHKFPLDKINKEVEVHTSFIQKLPFGEKKYRNYLPLFPLAIEQFNLSEYDLILSSSYAVTKNVLTRPDQLHICYCHSPIRYAWDLYFQYLKEARLERGIKAFFVKMILHYIRMWDFTASSRVDHFIANSKYIAKRIKKVYNRDAIIIYPPVPIEKFSVSEKREGYYLTASRMVPYKKIDLIVSAFSKLPDKKLIVIGDGPDFNKIKKNAGKNIELLGHQSFEELKKYMQTAKAFVFAAEEDFGIVPVEAQACGTPIIAFGKGGALETVVEGKTGIFFHDQTERSLVDAIHKFEKINDTLNPSEIRKNAERFSTEIFKTQYTSFVNNAYQKFRNDEKPKNQ